MSLFVAIEVPADVRARVRTALDPVMTVAPDLRFTKPPAWHVTLAFLGNVPASTVAALGATLADASARHRPFTVGLDGRAGTFGRSVLWAGFAPSPQLGILADDVRAATRLVVGDALDERTFTPHLTLARAPGRGRRIPRAAVLAYSGPQASWSVDRFALLSSDGRVAGGAYPVLQEWSLGA